MTGVRGPGARRGARNGGMRAHGEPAASRARAQRHQTVLPHSEGSAATARARRGAPAPRPFQAPRLPLLRQAVLQPRQTYTASTVAHGRAALLVRALRQALQLQVQAGAPRSRAQRGARLRVRDLRPQLQPQGPSGEPCARARPRQESVRLRATRLSQGLHVAVERPQARGAACGRRRRAALPDLRTQLRVACRDPAPSQGTRGQPHRQGRRRQEIHLRALRPAILHRQGRAASSSGAYGHARLSLPSLPPEVRSQGPLSASRQERSPVGRRSYARAVLRRGGGGSVRAADREAGARDRADRAHRAGRVGRAGLPVCSPVPIPYGPGRGTVRSSVRAASPSTRVPACSHSARVSASLQAGVSHGAESQASPAAPSVTAVTAHDSLKVSNYCIL